MLKGEDLAIHSVLEAPGGSEFLPTATISNSIHISWAGRDPKPMSFGTILLLPDCPVLVRGIQRHATSFNPCVVLAPRAPPRETFSTLGHPNSASGSIEASKPRWF